MAIRLGLDEIRPLDWTTYLREGLWPSRNPVGVGREVSICAKR